MIMIEATFHFMCSYCPILASSPYNVIRPLQDLHGSVSSCTDRFFFLDFRSLSSPNGLEHILWVTSTFHMLYVELSPRDCYERRDWDFQVRSFPPSAPRFPLSPSSASSPSLSPSSRSGHASSIQTYQLCTPLRIS